MKLKIKEFAFILAIISFGCQSNKKVVDDDLEKIIIEEEIKIAENIVKPKKLKPTIAEIKLSKDKKVVEKFEFDNLFVAEPANKEELEKDIVIIENDTQALINKSILIKNGNKSSSKKSTLNNVVLGALKKHPQINKLESLIAVAGDDVSIAKAGYYPTIDARVSVAQEKIRNETIKKAGDEHYTYETVSTESLIIRQTLYDGGKTTAMVDKNRALEARTHFDVLDGKEALALRVTEIYLDILRVRKQVYIAKENISAHKKILKTVEDRFKNNLVPKADVAQVRGRLALAEAQLWRNKNDLQNAEINYMEATGERVPKLFEPNSPKSDIPSSLNKAKDRLVYSHPAMLGSRETINAVDASIDEAKSNFYPKFGAELSAARNRNSGGYDNEEDRYDAMLYISYNIFAGGANKSLLSRERNRRDKEEYQLLETKRLLLRNLFSAWITKNNKIKEMAFYIQHLKSSKDSYEAYKSQYEMGNKRTLFDLLNARSEYFVAKYSVIDARYSILASEFRILASMGELVPYLSKK